MALIKKKLEAKKEKIRVEINGATFDMMKKYCSWSHIEDIGYFIEEAAHFVFKKDKEWKKYLEQNSNPSNRV